MLVLAASLLLLLLLRRMTTGPCLRRLKLRGDGFFITRVCKYITRIDSSDPQFSSSRQGTWPNWP